jgi:hypothetical protein
LRAELRRLNLKLSDGVQHRNVADGVVIGIDIGGAIQHVCVIVGAAAGGAQAAHLVQPDGVLLHLPSARARARHQQCKLDELPPVQRKRDNLFLADHRPLSRRLGIQHRNRASHLHQLGRAAELEPRVQRGLLGDLQPHAVVGEFLEAAGLYGELIESRRQQAELISAGRAAHCGARDAGCLVLQVNRGTSNRRAAGVGYLSGERACISLAEPRGAGD